MWNNKFKECWKYKNRSVKNKSLTMKIIKQKCIEKLAYFSSYLWTICTQPNKGNVKNLRMLENICGVTIRDTYSCARTHIALFVTEKHDISSLVNSIRTLKYESSNLNGFLYKNLGCKSFHSHFHTTGLVRKLSKKKKYL